MEERKNSDYTKYYENIELIGTGGFGYVYKVREKGKENNFRAVKVIKLDHLRESIINESGLDNLEENVNSHISDYIKEYEIMKICSENNVNSVKCYEYFQSEESFAIVMELCDKNLYQILNEKRKKCNEGFKPEEIYEIMKQLNNAFKKMKENKVIHRDLKLENILVKYNDKDHNNFTLKLSDYGCSRRLDSLSRNKCITNVGTLIYTAPEILNREEYNYKIDLWSIGIIIYRLKFVVSPFNGVTDLALLNNINNFKKSELGSTGNKELDDLIKILIEKEPTKRASWNEYLEHPFFKDKKE
jgi:serine/threonine protein kinase